MAAAACCSCRPVSTGSMPGGGCSSPAPQSHAIPSRGWRLGLPHCSVEHSNGNQSVCAGKAIIRGTGGVAMMSDAPGLCRQAWPPLRHFAAFAASAASTSGATGTAGGRSTAAAAQPAPRSLCISHVSQCTAGAAQLEQHSRSSTWPPSQQAQWPWVGGCACHSAASACSTAAGAVQPAQPHSTLAAGAAWPAAHLYVAAGRDGGQQAREDNWLERPLLDEH